MCYYLNVHFQGQRVNRQKVLRGPSARTVLILVRYRVNANAALVPQLQLWHHQWLLYAQSASNLYSQAPCSHVSRRPCSTHLNTLASGKVAHISMHEYHMDYYGYRGLRARCSIRHVCIPSSVNTALHCVLSEHFTGRYIIVTKNAAGKCATPFDGDVSGHTLCSVKGPIMRYFSLTSRNT